MENFLVFPKIYLGNCYFSQLLLTPSFFNKVNSFEVENSIYFDAMFEMVYFLEYFLYCKISFLELFSASCFVCILQTQLVFWYFVNS